MEFSEWKLEKRIILVVMEIGTIWNEFKYRKCVINDMHMYVQHEKIEEKKTFIMFGLRF